MSDKVIWSNSKVSWLRQCSRKFYFADQLATHGHANRLRRKAFELKQMQNIQMWQGSVVDKVLEKYIIPDIKDKKELNFNHYSDLAVELAKGRYDFSEKKIYLDRKVSKKAAGDIYCILDAHEINNSWNENEFLDALENIRCCILNIPDTKMGDGSTLLLDYLFSAKMLIPNVNNWIVTIEDALVKPQVDLILFDANWKPAVIDWKVSKSWVSDYSKQLQIIGVMVYLKRLAKNNSPSISYEDINLFEVNLLKKKVKQHKFSEQVSAEIIDYINLTTSDIQLITSEIKARNLEIQDFDTTDNQSTCNFCNFKSLCSFLIKNNFKYDEKVYNESLQTEQLVGN